MGHVIWGQCRLHANITINREEGGMQIGNNAYMTIGEACALLNVSRQTLSSYRQKYALKEYKIRGRILLSTVEILKRLYMPTQGLATPTLDFTVAREFSIEDSEVTTNVFDIRLIRRIDAFGTICLLCCLKDRIQKKQSIYLLTGSDSTSLYLRSARFFEELKRVDSEFVNVDDAILETLSNESANIILPLHLIGYKGKEKAILDELYRRLGSQGFSEDLQASLGWTLGELADNASTHSGAPCYFMLSSQVGEHKSLTLTIGDVGVGIPPKIKSKKTYGNLTDPLAFVSAFKANVTSWDDLHKRGKGLNDLLAIAKGNDACVRAESNEQCIVFDFEQGANSLAFRRASTRATGTRYCVVLIDSNFDMPTKSEIDGILDEFMEDIL